MAACWYKDCRGLGIDEPQELQQGEMRGYGATSDNPARSGPLILQDITGTDFG
jgi:hypothetical protein